MPTEEEIRAKMISHLRVKTIEDFLSDPAGFKAFKAFLQSSKLSGEYTDFLSFWEEVPLMGKYLTN